MFNGLIVPILQHEKVLEIVCAIMWIYLTLLNDTLKNC